MCFTHTHTETQTMQLVGIPLSVENQHGWMFLVVHNEPPGWWLWFDLPQHESLRRKRSPHILHFEFCCLLGSSWGLWDAHEEGQKAGGTRVWELGNQISFRLANCGWPQGSWAMPFGQGLIFTGSHLLYGSVTSFWNLFFTSLFWLGSGIHKIPREREAWSMACKRRSGEVGEWIEEESFPLPCHSLPSAGLTPLQSCRLLKRGERKGGERGGKLPSPFGRQDPSLSI